MFVVFVGSLLTTWLWIHALRGQRRGAGRASSSPSRSGCGSRCCSPISPRRWPKARQGAGRRAARHAPEGVGEAAERAAARQRRTTRDAAAELREGDVVLVEAGDLIPATAKSSKASRRSTRARSPAKRAGDPRSGGDSRAVTGGTRVLSDWLVVRMHRQSRRDIPRPHDRDGRRRQAPEDAERDRARRSCSPR